MVSSPEPEERAPASPVSRNGNGRTVASPVSHMHPDVAELLRAADSTARRRRRKKPAADELHARYECAFEEEEQAPAFAPPRLVWAKVLGHPWWPGQVFAPADASAPALREKRRPGAVLVACFGDGTFVWSDAEDLLPFRHGFPRLADAGGRSSSKSAFARALDDALGEVSRRVDAGLSCGCDGAAADSVRRQQVFVNSGIRRGARGAVADEAFARNALRGEALVGYVRALALAPGDGADRLDLAVAAAQLKAFARWRSAANPARDSAAVAKGAMVVAARAGRGRATTPRRERTRRGLLRGDAPAPAGDETTRSMCPRAAAAAAADMVFMRHMFPREAAEEHASATAVTPPGAGAELRGLAVATTAQGKKAKAFDEWRSPSPPRGIHECTAIRGGIDNGSTAGADGDADAGNCRTVTSCISEEEDSACEKYDGDAAAWETESEDSEPMSFEWELGWKEYVMVVQFLAIAMLLCRLIQ